MLPIWNSAIQCIDFAIDPSQIMGFFFFLAECQTLVMSSTTWHQRRVDNIFLTIDRNKRTQIRWKMLCTADYKEDISVLIYLPFGSDALQPNMIFWSGKWLCFKVRVTVRVRAFFTSSTTYAWRKDGYHLLDHKFTPTPKIKGKTK